MFPLSFSSSSSLSSIPPSLDSISELDRALSDISEDDDRAQDAEAEHSLWSLPSNTLSLFTDQCLADHGRLIQTSPSSQPIPAPQTFSSELGKCEEGVTRATAGLANLRQWFSLKGVVKLAAFILCFLLVLGKNESRCLPRKIFAGLTEKLNIFFNISGPKYSSLKLVASKLHKIMNHLAFQWTRFLAFLTHFPFKLIKCITTLPLYTKQLQFPKAYSITCPQIISFSTFSSFSSCPSLPFLTFFCPSNFTASVNHYLLNPSPLFLPCLLALFLLVVMLTASQSVVLALILATPLGLTLSYLETAVSSRRKTISPVFISDEASERNISSGADQDASALTQTHPHTRQLGGTSWIPEMCDPAA